MPRKKVEGITTYPRFKIKAFAVGMGIGHGDVEMAKEYANAVTQARASGYGIYKNAYAEIKPVLMEHQVPSAFWGLYKAFANELIHKVQIRKISTIDEVIAKWEKQGLDGNVLRDCADAVVEVVAEGTPKPASKTA